jgi:molybdate transport system substrate-binding protein
MPARFVTAACISWLLLASCGGSPPPVASADAASRPISVFAAASLTAAFNQAGRNFENLHPATRLQFNFAGSAALSAQIQQGAEADVFASADQANMQKLVDAGLVTGGPQIFARNRLEIVVAAGNPKKVSGLNDFARTDLVLALCAAAVPCGRYANEAFSKAQIKVGPASQEQDVRSVVARVGLGEADAGIAYQTDVRAAGRSVQGIQIPDAQNVIASYPIAILKEAKNPTAALVFVDYLRTGRGQEDLSAFGFLPP